MKTAKLNENGDEIYEILSATLNQAHDGGGKHSIVVNLCVRHIDEETDHLYHELYVDKVQICSSTPINGADPKRAYMDARKAWRRAMTNVLNENWPIE